MKSRKVWPGVALIFLVMLATNVPGLALLVADKNDPINTIEKERSGILYLEPLRQLRQWLPAYRRLAETDPTLIERGANAPSLLNIERAITRLDELDRKLEHQLNTTEDFVALKTDWSALQNAVSHPESIRPVYAKLNTQARALIALIGDSSTLMLDPVLNSFYLINVVVVDLPNSDDLLNNLLDLGNKLMGRPRLRAEDNNKLLIMAAALRNALNDTNSHLKVAIDADQTLAPLDVLKREYDVKVLTLLAYLDKNMIGQRSVKITGADYASAVQPALDANFKLYDAVSPRLDRVLQRRGNRLRADKREAVDLVLLLLLAGLVATAWIVRGMIVPINRAMQPSLGATTLGPVEAAPADTLQQLMRENQDLKSLVAELSLHNRSLKAGSSGAGPPGH